MRKFPIANGRGIGSPGLRSTDEGVHQVTRRVLAAACAAATIVALAPSVAVAATHTVFAGGDGVVKNAPRQFSPNAFLRKTITIHVGDTVRWRFRGFHTVTVPARGKQPPAFAIPGQSKVTGVLDPAGVPFWFNNVLPTLGVNRKAAAPTKSTTYNGTSFRKLRPAGRQEPAVPAEVHEGRKLRLLLLGAPRHGGSRLGRELEAGQGPAHRRSRPRAQGPALHDQRVLPQCDQREGRPDAAVHDGRREHDRDPHDHARPAEPCPGAVRDQHGAINPEAAYPSDPPPAFPPYTGRNHGNGFFNLGLHDNDPATPPAQIGPTGAVTFAAAGTFQLEVPRARRHGRHGDRHSVAIAAATACGASRGRPWPAPGTSSSRAPASAPVSRRPIAA